MGGCDIAQNGLCQPIAAPGYRFNDLTVVEFLADFSNSLGETIVANKDIRPDLVQKLRSRNRRPIGLCQRLKQPHRARR